MKCPANKSQAKPISIKINSVNCMGASIEPKNSITVTIGVSLRMGEGMFEKYKAKYLQISELIKIIKDRK